MADFMEALKEKKKNGEAGTTALVVKDLPVVKKSIHHWKDEIDQLLKAVEEMEIRTDEQEKNAVTLAGRLKSIYNEMEGIRKAETEQPRQYVNKVNSFAKPFTGPVEKAIKVLKNKVTQYGSWKRLQEAKQQQLIDQKNRELQEELNKEAKKAGVEAPTVTPVSAPKVETTVHGEGASMHTRKEWKCKIVDPEKVPREYCIPDQRLLDRAVKAGVREIDGCQVHEEEIPVLR